MLRPLRIAITSGDANGIGPEVVSKALKRLGPQKNVHFFLWRNSDFPQKDLRRIQSAFKLTKVGSWAEALSKTQSSSKELVDICGHSNPAIWVEEAAQACYFKHLDGMATAPLSKPTIKESGMRDVGHTDILKRVAQVRNAHMVFLGKEFNTFLATGHLPISEVTATLNAEKLTGTLFQAGKLVEMLSDYDEKLLKKPVAVLGLNPHAGDSGVIGLDDENITEPAVAAANAGAGAVKFVGPLVPDAAFLKNVRQNYSLYVAMYHDQGLIPFKTVHGVNGVHLTWGLPFIRTSVDHGTAFDIAGKNKADETSMLLAIKWALRLAKGMYES